MSNVKGLDKLLKNLDKMPREVRKIVDDVTFVNVLEVEANAKIAAPVDFGFLSQTIVASRTPGLKKDEIGYSVYALAHYAPYMEFGTGGLVSVPPELQDLAIQFKGKGIRQVNIRPRPFLYPALVRQRPIYVKDLEDNLQPYLDKI